MGGGCWFKFLYLRVILPILPGHAMEKDAAARQNAKMRVLTGAGTGAYAMDNSDKWLIHRHVATELDSRLAVVRQVPQQIVLAGADGDVSRRLLAQRYPQAKITECDTPERLQAALDNRPKSWLDKWRGSTLAVQKACNPNRELPAMAADMLWANLSLPLADDLTAALENWTRALKTDGMLFFSHLGAESLQEVRGLLAEQGVECAAPTLVDMHDLGDMLFHHGFYDPVMDTFSLRLTYDSESSLHADWETLDIWRILQPSDTARAQQIVDEAHRAGRLPHITLETVYGHALCRAKLNEGEQLVQFHRPQKPV